MVLFKIVTRKFAVVVFFRVREESPFGQGPKRKSGRPPKDPTNKYVLSPRPDLLLGGSARIIRGNGLADLTFGLVGLFPREPGRQSSATGTVAPHHPLGAVARPKRKEGGGFVGKCARLNGQRMMLFGCVCVFYLKIWRADVYLEGRKGTTRRCLGCSYSLFFWQSQWTMD